LESRGSISAGIRYQVRLFDKELVGRGNYWELRQPGVPLMRMELRIQIDDQVSSLLQVCDGRYLWTYRNLPETATVTQIDAVRATRALEQLATVPNRNPAAMLPGLGGLSKLLRALDANFHFTSVTSGWLDQQDFHFTATREQAGQRPVWRLEGGWQTSQLIRLLPKQQEAISRGKPVDLSRLPQHIPDQVVVCLGQEDWFPRSIEYRRAVEKAEDAAAADTSRAIVTMQLFDVYFNVPIEAQQFVYKPGSVQASDQTEAFLQSLGLPQP
jgi:hypothetical protein